MENKNKPFIRTTDENIAKELRIFGYVEMNSGEKGVYLFINQGSSEDVQSGAAFSNILCI